MRLRLRSLGIAPGLARALLSSAILVLTMLAATPSPAADAQNPPAMDTAMSSAGWLQDVFVKLERELVSDVSMLPDTPSAFVREWRSFDREGSASGALVNVGWVVLATLIALAAERGTARGLSRRLRREMRNCPRGPTLGGLLLLLVCDLVALAVFFGVAVHSRHELTNLGVTAGLMILAVNVLIRWRIAVLVFRLVLRPAEPVARLIAMPDDEARRLMRFLSAALLGIMILVGFGRYGLMDEDSGAPHVIALIVLFGVAGLNTLIVFRARAMAEALIRGGSGFIGALRDAVAQAWLAIGMIYVAGVCVFFIFSLSLGLLSYLYATTSTLGIIVLLLVLNKLAARGWNDAAPAADTSIGAVERAMTRGVHRILSAIVLFGAALTVAWFWIDALDQSAEAAQAMRSTTTALMTLFIAYLAWELVRLGIDRNLQVAAGPKLPGTDDDDEAAPGSRLQTILPMVRVAFGILIAVVGALIVLSRLGIDTAPLIAGAGVFGLAISFGAQSLVRDIISGLFYLWDDAFRVGEYIDTGRLRGTVEALGMRSVKLRHHNGPLHTIPYGQLGAVTNLSRDFATIKFNLRLEPGTDIELVRRTAKRIGIEMQDDPEIAAEVILPLKMQGIAEVADTAVVVRFKFTARPIKPTYIQRLYLKRMYGVFAETGIHFATGALVLQTQPAPALSTEVEALSPVLAGAIASPTPLPAATRVA